MRNIIDLDGTEYLKRTYECAQAYKKYVADSGVMDILAASGTDRHGDGRRAAGKAPGAG